MSQASMVRVFLLVVALSHTAFAFSLMKRSSDVDNHLLELLKRMGVNDEASKGEREVKISGVNLVQSSAVEGFSAWKVASKAVDGRYDDSNFFGADGSEYGGSCTVTDSESNPYWGTVFEEEICISRVRILNRGDGFNEKLTGAEVQFGVKRVLKLNTNPTCGSPVTAEQAAVPGGTIEVECSEPIRGRFLMIGIPADNATLQLCEVRVWAIPMDQCPPEFTGETELDLNENPVGQSSAVGAESAEEAAKNAIDGQYDNTKLLGVGGEMYGGSCTITKPEQNPYWGIRFFKEYCINKIRILNRGDGVSERLTGAVVRIGSERTTDLNKNTACGSPVTAEQAAVPGGTIEVECSHPIKGDLIFIGIPADHATLQLCEVRVWAVPVEQCSPDFDECSSDPCQNGATCVDGVFEFSCTCAAGFTGPLCEDDIDECSGDKCQNGATCVGGIADSSCTCVGGFTGRHCEDDFDECSSDPCQNGATCVDGVFEFSCTCAAGFTGPLCEDDIDECSGDKCQNGATCVGGIADSSCTCVGGFTGRHCEDDSKGESEVKITGINLVQSSAVGGFSAWKVASKAVDGRVDDSNFLGKDGSEYGGSCTITDSESNPYWGTVFEEEICISRVRILNRGDGFSEKLTGAVVQFGVKRVLKLGTNPTCGSPVTAEQAAVPGGTIEFECSEPIRGRFLMIGIPADNATLQLCEVRVWAIPMDQCPAEFTGETELDLNENPVGQSSAVGAESAEEAAKNAIDGQYDNTKLLGVGGEMYGGSCTITKPEENPYWGMRFFKEYCISKIRILNRGDGFSERLTGAVVRIGSERTTDLNKNTACGSPVTAEQAAVPGGTIEVECSHPIKGDLIFIGIPADNATLQLCEVRVWAVPVEQCSPDFDECSSDPCQNGATCVDGVFEFLCTCAAGFTGPLCEDDLDECSSDPCQNGATCVDGINEFSCMCAAGFLGSLCKDDIDECSSDPCQKGATCVDGINEFSCACAAGFTGPLCADDLNECDSNPCRNGVCIEGVNSFTCECSPGYEGANCETNIDECVSNPCQNGATCVDGINEVSCTCAEGFTGSVCQTDLKECDSNPCQNGVCIEGVGSFTCECSPGYEGSTCQTNIDECVSNPCQNGATCVDGINEVSCTCVEGFTGSVCETDVDECGSNPCRNGGTCVDGVNKVSCSCAAGFTGVACEIDVKGCDDTSCQNGVCMEAADGFTCKCSPGYEGANCETNIDECISNPCQNGATCIDGINQVSCTCVEGFNGSVCETIASKTNGCTLNPCENGVCIIQGMDGFKCACSPGYEGANCEINIDECSSNPCQNDAECVDGINKVSCICAPGFCGQLCQNEQGQGPSENLPQPPIFPAGAGNVIQTSYMQVNLVTEYCVKKVIVHKRANCTSEHLTGAVVRGGTSSTSLNNGVCGTPLTARQAEVPRSTVDFICDPPMTAKFVTVDIPLLRVSQKPPCEVTIEQATPGPC